MGGFSYHILYLLSFLLLLFSYSSAIAQKTTLRFEQYSIEEGLTGNSITSMLQDSAGYLWIGTSVGLNRYDGNEMKHYQSTKRDSSGLADDFVHSLFLDQSGIIWAGTKKGGLHRYNRDGDVFEQFDLAELLNYRSVPPGFSPNEIFDIDQSIDGRLWLATRIGLVIFDPVKNQASIESTEPMQPVAIQSLFIDDEQRLWYGDDAGYVWRKTITTSSQNLFETAKSLLKSTAKVSSLTVSGNGLIWAATDGDGLYRFSSDSDSFERFTIQDAEISNLSSYAISTVLADNQDRLWIGYSSNGLGLLYPDGTYYHFRNDANDRFSLANNELLTLLNDRSGNIWIGTWSGLSKLSPWFEGIKLFTSSSEQGFLPEKRILQINEDDKGDLWLGTMGGGLIQLNLTTRKFKQYTSNSTNGELCDDVIHDSHFTNEEVMWLATHYKGLCAFAPDPANYQAASRLNDIVPDSLKGTDVLSLHETLTKSLFVGTQNRGLGSFDILNRSVAVHQAYSIADSLPANYVWPIVDGDGTTVWLGVFDEGMVQYDLRTERFTTYTLDEGNAASNRIYDVIHASNGFLWIATDAGAIRFNPEDSSSNTFTELDGLAFNSVRGIVEDNEGDIWFSTNNGLSRFTPSSNSFKNFNVTDGLQSNRFYAGAAQKLSDGQLAFGGPEGLNIINPLILRGTSEQPILVLSKLLVNGEPHVMPTDTPIHKMNHLILEPDENRFSLSFAVLDFANVKENQYQYRLTSNSNSFPYIGKFFSNKTSERSWVNQGSDPDINFPTLPYGEHQLEVKGIDSENNKTATMVLPITVKTPLVQRDWFRALMLLCVLGLIYGIIELRKRYLWHLDRVRLRLASSLHDDVGASLATIGMKIGLLERRAKFTDNEKRQLKQIGEIARETGRGVRDTEWIIKSENDTLDQLISQLRDLADTMLSGLLTYSFDCSPTRIPVMGISMSLKENVFLLCKEAFNNANKYSQATKVEITVRIEQSKIFLTIIDDGIGFKQDKIGRTNGLSHMATRAEEIGAQLEINSLPQNGTTIRLCAPLRQNWLKRLSKSLNE